MGTRGFCHNWSGLQSQSLLMLGLCLAFVLPVLAQSTSTVTTTDGFGSSTNNGTTISPEPDAPPPLWKAIVTLVLLVGMLVCMALEIAPPDMIMMSGLVLFVPMGIVTISEATVGFSNKGMLTVAVLFVVASGVQLTGAIEPLRRLLERMSTPKSGTLGLERLILLVTLPIGALSAFLNNTPVVAMMIPLLQQLGKRLRVPPSKLLIPLSYSAILGGTCTLTGTSTNLVVVGLAQDRIEGFSMGLFEIGMVGLPVMMAGLFIMMVLGPKMLPNRQGVTEVLSQPREFITCMFVRTRDEPDGGVLAGKSVASAGLRSLSGLYLVQIERASGDVISAPGPAAILNEGDKLFFAGVVESVLSLSQIRGLRLAESDEQHVDLYSLRGDDVLVEAVVAAHSALVHRTVKDVRFRTRFQAAIIAVHRHGVRIEEKIGNIVLQAGDTLLLVCKGDFVQRYKNSPQFALVSQVDGHQPLRRNKAPIAVLLALLMIALSVAEVLDLLTAALISSIGLVLFRCMSCQEVRAAINLEVLIVISAAFGLSNALVNSGAASLLASWVVAAAKPTGTTGLYIMIYLSTALFSAAVTNNAAVTIMFPVAYQAVQDTGDDFRPILYVLMLGASASFLTPTGYQTNLMVYGPGGYVFMDYVRFGGVLQLILGVVTISIIVTVKYWYVWLIVTTVLVLGATLVCRKPFSSYQPGDDLPLTRPIARETEMYFYQPDLGLSPMQDLDDVSSV
eukprot:m.11475 g.11475  ORF g.11475 m.11475 type:complete len:732 (-) comp5730_c1_seq1:171-2366(-)